MKTLNITLLLLLPMLGMAQFTLTTQGMRTAANGESYQVYEMPGKTQAAIYKDALLYLNGIYANPKEVLSMVEGEMITISAREPNMVRRNKLHVFNMDYSISLEFKDGKMKVNAPSFTLTTITNGRRQQLGVQGSSSISGGDMFIYNRSGKLKSELAKADLDAFFNAFIANLVEGMNGKDW